MLEALGHHLMSQGRYAEAAQAFATTVQLQPERDESRFQMAVALARSGRYEQALSHFQRVVGEAAAHYNVGIIAYESGDVPTAELHFASAVAADPRLAESPEWQRRHQNPPGTSPAEASSSVEPGDVLQLLSTALGANPSAALQSQQGIEIVPNRPRTQRIVRETGDDAHPLR